VQIDVELVAVVVNGDFHHAFGLTAALSVERTVLFIWSSM
jgi:hypothetical protein